MNFFHIHFIIINSIILLTSCDCPVHKKGYVLDSMTEKPIKDARIKFDKQEYHTDSLGYFEIDYVTGFCPAWDFQIEKTNYRNENILVERTDNQIIYKVQETTKNSKGAVIENSLNFKVKNDTIHFFLTHIN